MRLRVLWESIKVEPTICICFMKQLCKSSHPDVYCKEGVLKSFAKLKGKHLCRSLFFNNFAKFLRTLFSRNCGGRFQLCTEVGAHRCSMEKLLWKRFQNSQEKTCDKVINSKSCLNEFLPWEFFENFSNTFFTEQLLSTSEMFKVSNKLCWWNVFKERHWTKKKFS